MSNSNQSSKMDNINKAVHSLDTLVGVWHPVDVPRIMTMYYSSAQSRNWISRAREIISDRISIPVSVRQELQNFPTEKIEAIITKYAKPTKGLTPDEEKAVSKGREDLTALIMADYILIAYGDHLDSVHGAASIQSCVDAVTDMLPV